MKPVPLSPTGGDACLRWELGGLWVQSEPHRSGWCLTRSWSPTPLLLSQEPRVGVRVGEDQIVAQLAEPLGLSPGESAELWLPWPLELLVFTGEEVVHDAARIPLRRTMLGSVEKGRVLPVTLCEVLLGPTPTDPLAAALHVVVQNNAATAVTVRRFPVSEPPLRVFQLDGGLVLGSVRVDVVDGSQAEVRVEALSPPPGAIELPRPQGPQRSGLQLQWLLDATRRSAGFQL